MNILQPWNIVFLIGLVVYFNIRRVIIKRLNLMAQQKTVRHVDALEKTLLMAMFATTLFLPLLYLFTPLFSFADYRLPEFVPWVGVVLMVTSLWLFWRSHADLGRNWSVSLEIREGHQLVTDGVYRYIRHPMYTSIWLWAFAQGMLLANWLVGWSMLPAFAAMYFVRVPREEHMMCETFGDPYRDYMRKTGRILPRIIIKKLGCP